METKRCKKMLLKWRFCLVKFLCCFNRGFWQGKTGNGGIKIIILDKEGVILTKAWTSRNTWIGMLFTLIKNRQYPDCRNHVAILEVSPRTIERDIEQLCDQMQAPIEDDRLGRGYYFTEDFPCLNVE
jgi:hypothetical protein